jgi:hypothetical protein
MSEELNKLLINISSTSIKDDGNCITIKSLTNNCNNTKHYEICKKDQERLYNEIKKHFKFSNK